MTAHSGTYLSASLKFKRRYNDPYGGRAESAKLCESCLGAGWNAWLRGGFAFATRAPSRLGSFHPTGKYGYGCSEGVDP